MAERPKAILCVDDESNPLLLRTLILKKAGFETLSASSASEALEVLASHAVDLVLTDVLMPGTSGTELAKEVKNRRPDLPVILLSGVNEVPAEAGCADLFLSKLEGPNVLCERINELLIKYATTRTAR